MVCLESIRDIDAHRASGRILPEPASLISRLPTAKDVRGIYDSERAKGHMTTSIVVLGFYGLALLLGRVLGSL
jgi:hypothetical protein